MKKIFIIISIVMVNVFLIINMINNHHKIQFFSYPSVDIVGNYSSNYPTNRTKFTQELTNLADAHHSLIARRIVQPNEDNQIQFMYQIYGHQLKPKGMIEAPINIAEQSDLINGYLIIGGDLDTTTLVNKLESLGYQAVGFSQLTKLQQVIYMISHPMTLLSLVILTITFGAMTLIERIQNLRYASIRLVSGESLIKVVLRDITSDVMTMLITVSMLVLVDSLIFIYYHQIPKLQIILTFIALLLVCLIFIVISLVLSMIYVMNLKQSSLKLLIKGKLPIGRLLFIMLISQILAIMIIGWTANEANIKIKDYQTLHSAKEKWQENSQLYQLNYGMSSGMITADSQQSEERWYYFVDDMIKNDRAMLVANHLRDIKLGKADSNQLEHNVIYVTPNYLKRQHLKVDDKLFHLKKGQFGLILPQKLIGNIEYYSDYFAKQMMAFGQQDVNITAIVDSVPDSQPQFIYNLDDASIETQYMVDPIIIVITPTSTGNSVNSLLFWNAELGRSILFNQYDKTIQDLKDNGLYPWVAYVLNGNIKYLSTLAYTKLQLVTLVIGSVMTIITAIILFISMNILYFDKFRRDILIKYIAGMTHLQIHWLYLMIQLSMLATATILLIYMTHQLILPIVILIFFIMLILGIFYLQNKREQQIAVTVLKGQ